MKTTINSKSESLRVTKLVSAMCLSAMFVPGLANASNSATVFTSTADFANGVFSGVNATSVANQLQLEATGTTFPLVWIANAGEDSLSKIDTNINAEVARYRTWFGPAGQPGYYGHINGAWSGAAPSRSAVDIYGNAYIANRQFRGDVPASVVKVLSSGGIDRNHNNLIDTSRCAGTAAQPSCIDSDPLQLLPLGDANGNNKIDTAEIQDEAIAWAAEVGPRDGLGRSLCIAPDGNLWVGLYNAQQYWNISSADGHVIAGPISTASAPGNGGPGWNAYGCLVDAQGRLWSASLGPVLGMIDTKTNVVKSWYSNDANYGIALGNGKVYTASQYGYSYSEFDPVTETFSHPAQSQFYSLGISVDGNGDIIVGNHSYGVTKFAPNGTVKWVSPQNYIGDTRGVIVDSNNDIWQVNLDNNSVSKYRGSDGALLAIVPVGNHPYTYSDASGFAARNQTNRTGTWTVTKDGAANGTLWNQVQWTADIPQGASVVVKARASDNAANLANLTWTTLSNGGAINLAGRYLQVEARLSSGTQTDTPVVKDVTLWKVDPVAKCDVDANGSINILDINAIYAALNQTVSPTDVRDFDSDGKITVKDVRACTLKCTKAQCAK